MIYINQIMFSSRLYMLPGVSLLFFSPLLPHNFNYFFSGFPIPSKSARFLISMCLLQLLLQCWFWVTLLCLQFPSLTVTEKYSFGVLGGSESVVRPWKRITIYIESGKGKRPVEGEEEKGKEVAHSLVMKPRFICTGVLLHFFLNLLVSFILHNGFGHMV